MVKGREVPCTIMSNDEKKKRPSDALLIDERDNVGIALRELASGEVVHVVHRGAVRISSTIPVFHKFALERIEPGKPIIKYGEEIGRASTTIEAGEHVHVHNLVCERGRGLPVEDTR